MDENRGKSIWQIYIDFEPSISNCSGSATVEFSGYKHKKFLNRKTESFDWLIPSNVSTKEYIYTTLLTTQDFDSVGVIELESIVCSNPNYE